MRSIFRILGFKQFGSLLPAAPLRFYLGRILDYIVTVMIRSGRAGTGIC